MNTMHPISRTPTLEPMPAPNLVARVSSGGSGVADEVRGEGELVVAGTVVYVDELAALEGPADEVGAEVAGTFVLRMVGVCPGKYEMVPLKSSGRLATLSRIGESLNRACLPSQSHLLGATSSDWSGSSLQPAHSSSFLVTSSLVAQRTSPSHSWSWK